MSSLSRPTSRCQTLALAAALILWAVPDGRAQACSQTQNTPSGKLYWTESDAQVLRSSNFDGSGVQTLFTSPNNGLLGIAVDPVGGKLYFTDDNSLSSGIRRMNLDGTLVEMLVPGGAPTGITLDVGAGHMYWTDAGSIGTQEIRRAQLNGAGVTLVVGGLGDPIDIEVDPSAGKLYWTDAGTGKVQCSNLDGSMVTDLATGLGVAAALRLDTDYDKLYFSSVDQGKVWRMNTDGSGLETLISGLVGLPYAIAIANGLDLMLVCEAGLGPGIGTVTAYNTDGANPKPLHTGLNNPVDVVLWHDPLPPLHGDVADVCLAVGASQRLFLDAKPAHAGKVYLMLGSASGTTGIPVDGLTLPLTFDAYTVLSLNRPSPPFVGFLGILDSVGRGEAKLLVPPSTDPSLAGIVLSHAYLVLDLVAGKAVFASNAEQVQLIP
ncbi:MAG: hypothetical protein P1V81_11865 [Planctomycetota bacterium]|nr:hypothetical protein [Planctomycetota bacterium]